MKWFGFGRKKKSTSAEKQRVQMTEQKQQAPSENTVRDTENDLTNLDKELSTLLDSQCPDNEMDEPDARLIQASFNAGELLFEIKEYEEAEEYLFEAAAAGHARAQYYLGEMNYNGWGVPENDIAAAEWYRLAAQQGEKDAMFKLGLLLSSGTELLRDLEEAAKWYRLAAEHGHEEGWYHLGLMHMAGMIGEEADMESAVACWTRSGELGYMAAQVQLGDYYHSRASSSC